MSPWHIYGAELMDLDLQSPSPDDADGKPSFRKPSNEAVHRKYRRHSPVNESPSSSSESLKHDRSPSPPFTRDDLAKSSYDSRKRKDDGREMHMDSGRSRSDKDGDSYRSSERHSYGRSRNYSGHDDYSGYHRHANEEKNYKRSSGSGKESRSGTSDYTRRESKVDKARDHQHNVDKKCTREKHDDFYRNTDKERDIPALERQKPKERHSSSDRVTSDRRPTSSNLDEVKTGGRDRRDRDRERGRDDTKDYHRNSGEYKSNYTSLSDSRGEGKDSTTSKDRSGSRLKETQKTNTKELDRQNDEVMEKGKHDDRESDRLKARYGRGPDEKGNRSFTSGEGNGRNEQYEDKTSKKDHESSGKRLKLNSGSGDHHVKDGQLIPKSVSVAGEGPPSNSKQPPDAAVNVLANSAQSSANEAKAADDINAARVAAMKAAELVNRNLVGGGYMSTDQKKKLLWGNKKSTAAEEPVHRWDIPLFSDRERQEKFNKLMGVKGDVKPEQNQNGEEGSGGLAEKQEQLQLDLEKQYTAGLRRRDGRTVGLGL